MDEQIIRHAAGLIILMSVNIILGSLGSAFVKCFEWKRLGIGIFKSIIVLICFAATYIAGYLNPDILAINIGDVEANVMTALNIVVLFGYIHYAKQVIEKLAAMLGLNFGNEIKEKTRRRD
jgi:hypothetical protein